MRAGQTGIMKRRTFLVGSNAVLALVLSGCSTKMETFRYRLTVEVDTPQGLRSGYSVIEVKQSQTEKGFLVPAEARKLHFKTRGEAVAVDMPDDKVLFVLLNNAEGIAYAALRPLRLSGEFAHSRMTRNIKRVRSSADLPREAYPILVTFGDLADPTSVTEGNPDELSASFGVGVTLKRISLVMTHDAITTGIEERLSWINNLERYRTVSDNPFTNTLPREIAHLRAE